MAAEAGIRQFLDIGTGIPAANNTHEVAQSAAWYTSTTTIASRVVYTRVWSGCLERTRQRNAQSVSERIAGQAV
jgi:hypothetical protein